MEETKIQDVIQIAGKDYNKYLTNTSSDDNVDNLHSIFLYLNDYFKKFNNLNEVLLIIKEVLLDELSFNFKDKLNNLNYILSSYLQFKFPKQLTTCENCLLNYNNICETRKKQFNLDYYLSNIKNNYNCSKFKIIFTNDFDCFTHMNEYEYINLLNSNIKLEIDKDKDFLDYFKIEPNEDNTDNFKYISRYFAQLFMKNKLGNLLYGNISNTIIFYNKRKYKPIFKSYNNNIYNIYITDEADILLINTIDNITINFTDLYNGHYAVFESYMIDSI